MTPPNSRLGSIRAMTEIAQPVTKQPIFGILSIAFPLLGIPVAYILGLAVSIPTDGTGQSDVWGAASAFAKLSCLAILAGFISASIALVRAERSRLLPLLGFMASAAPILALVIYFHRV